MATLSALVSPTIAVAQETPSSSVQLEQSADKISEEIIVTGRRLSLVGEAISASEGVIGRQEINARPLLRAGDLLEFVPGLVATQHSGSGKAN